MLLPGSLPGENRLFPGTPGHVTPPIQAQAQPQGLDNKALMEAETNSLKGATQLVTLLLIHNSITKNVGCPVRKQS